MKHPFYLSVTIPYVNGDPHLGHALEYVQADAVCRYRRLAGDDVFFLGGTDENSLKNVQAAEIAGVPVGEFVEKKAEVFRRSREVLNISFDDFIRTTEERHARGARRIWDLCAEDIYKKQYRGLYCVGCEAFYTEDDLQDGLCPEHKIAPEVVEEENYFFRLSRYQEDIRNILESGTVRVVPDFRKNEMMALIERGLEDFSISRSVARAHGWGIPVPGDDTQIMYVWYDALSNYINALGFGGEQKMYSKYWEQEGSDRREVAHVLGKGVARFHLVYWLGMLLSAKIPLPTEQFVHGYVTVGNEKMSKSLGNVVHPYDLAAAYGRDAVRYFFLGAIPAYADGDFTIERFEEYYTAHLVNGVGNLTSRIVTMLEKYSGGRIPPAADDVFGTAASWQAYDRAFRDYRFDEAIAILSAWVTRADELISAEKPWETAKRGGDVSALLYRLSELLRHIAIGLLPIIPDSAQKMLAQLGVQADVVENDLKTGKSSLDSMRVWGVLQEGGAIGDKEILFQRLSTREVLPQ